MVYIVVDGGVKLSGHDRTRMWVCILHPAVSECTILA